MGKPSKPDDCGEPPEPERRIWTEAELAALSWSIGKAKHPGLGTAAFKLVTAGELKGVPHFGGPNLARLVGPRQWAVSACWQRFAYPQ
jgi:hypothetical protein